MDGIYLLILFIVSFIFGYIAKKSNVLRDTITDDAAFSQAADQAGNTKPKLPFSLSRTQMAFWTVIVISSFTYLWIKNGFIVPELFQVNLILLGISIGTTVVASVIDTSQQDTQRHQNQPSSGLIIDIISDGQGVSIHRLQNVLWTIVIGIIYIQYVTSSAKLPDSNVISNNLLILMGISNGAYITLKIPENKTTASAAPPPVVPVSEVQSSNGSNIAVNNN